MLFRSVGSIQNFASFICASFAPIITGFIVDTTHSFRLALIICGCVTAAGALAYIFLVRQPINDPRKINLPMPDNILLIGHFYGD